MSKASKKKVPKISAEEFDRRFDAGEDISDYIDWDNGIKKVNVDFPVWMVQALDEESGKLSIPRQALIKMWINDRIKYEQSGKAVEVVERSAAYEPKKKKQA